MGAEVKAKITVDAENALKRIEEINKASGYTSTSMSKLAKEIGETNAALSTLGGKQGGTASGTAFKNITDQLEKQALAYTLVDSKSKAAAQAASIYRNAIINLTKSGVLTKEQTDELVRTYNNYKTSASAAAEAAEHVKTAQVSVDKTTKDVSRSFKEQTTYLQKLFSVAKNILTFQLLMGPIRNGLRGIKDTLRESVSVAAEAEQRFSKLATVFDGIADSAKAMAQSVAGSIGVANSTSASALSTVGDLLQAQGMGTTQSLSVSAEWVKQFQDIIAFKDINMSLEEFAQNFMSGAAGNLRNFRTFGSIVKESAVNARLAAEGYDKLTGSQLELAKMTTRATIALEQQANAMGATEREWDTMLSVNRRLNEAWKEYKENLGDTLNRIIKPMKEAITEMLDDANRATRLAEQTATHQEIMAGSRPVSVLRDALTNADDAAQFKTFINELVQKAIVPNGGRADDPGSLAGQIAGLQTTNEYIEWFQKEYATQYLRRNPNASQEAANAYGLMMAQGAFAPSLESYKTNIQNGNEDLGTESLDLTNLAKTMIEFGVSIEKLKDATDNALPDIIYENIKAYRTMIDEGLTQRSRREGLESAYNSYSAMIEAISGMKVAGTPVAGAWDFDYYNQSSEGANALFEIIANAMSGAGSDAFANIMGANLAKTWGDAVAIALDGVDKSNLLEGKANSLKTLYGIILEYMPEEADLLGDIAKAYQDTNKEIADYNANIEAQKNALAALNGIIASAAERAGVKAYTDQGYSSEVASLMYSRDQAESSVRANWQTLYGTNAYAEIDGELRSLADVIAMATEAYDEQIKAINAAIEAERVEAYENALSTLSGNAETYEVQIAQLDMTEDERQLDDLYRAYKKLIGSLDLTEDEQRNLAEAYAKEEHALVNLIEKTNAAAEAEKKRAAMQNLKDSINPFKSYIDAYKEGKTALEGTSYFGSEDYEWSALGGGLMGILLELLKNTQVFQEVMNIVNDTIVPILDAVMKPLLPALETIRQLFDMIPWEFVLFCIKVLASTIVLILHPIKMIFAVLKNVYTVVHNILQRILHPISGGDQWSYVSLNEIADETNETLKKIWSTELNIERNTEKGDNYAKQLALLKSLYAGGALNLAEYTGAVASVTGSSMGRIESYAGTSYSRGGGGVTYFSGDIVINGYNGDPKELALEIERVLQKRAQAGGGTFA